MNSSVTRPLCLVESSGRGGLEVERLLHKLHDSISADRIQLAATYLYGRIYQIQVDNSSPAIDANPWVCVMGAWFIHVLRDIEG